MACQTDEEQLYAYLAGDFSQGERAALEEHLQKCPECSLIVAEMSYVLSILQSVNYTIGPGEALQRSARELARRIAKRQGTHFQSTVIIAEGPPAAGAGDATASQSVYGDMSELEGQKLDNYLLREILGRGGWGTVFRAEDTALGRTVAIKILRPHVTHNWQVVTRFEREARLMAKLEHPNVVKIYAFRQFGHKYFLVMEYVDGTNLSSVVKGKGPIPAKRSLMIAEGVAEGLGAAHAMKITHRDVSPNNILLANSGQPKLVDFGLARILGETFTRTGTILGTVSFMAPEQIIDSRKAGPASDIYGLGCTLFYMLTGHGPFSGREDEILWAHLHREAPDIREKNPSIPAPIAHMVARMLVKEPAKRIDNTDELLRAIAQARKLVLAG